MNLASQTFNAAWCLLGLPFIACALWGVRYRLEANLRLYLLYQFSSFCLRFYSCERPLLSQYVGHHRNLFYLHNLVLVR